MTPDDISPSSYTFPDETVPDLPVVATMTPPPPTSGASGPLRLVLIAVGAVLAAVIVLGGVLLLSHRGGLSLGSPTPGSLTAANSYCAALKSQDYTKAYSLYSSGTQSLVPQESFAPVAQLIDTRSGKVTACTADKATVAKDGKSAVVTGSLTRGTTTASKFSWQWSVTSAGTWQLSQVPDVTLIPLMTGYRFCGYLKAQQYDEAYGLLSANFQKGVGSADDLKNDLSQVAALTGPFTGCVLQQFTMATDGKTASLNAGADFGNFPNVPAKFALVADVSGLWKIDTLTLTILGNPVDLPPSQ